MEVTELKVLENRQKLTIIDPTDSCAPWETIRTFLNHYVLLITFKLSSCPILALIKIFPVMPRDLVPSSILHLLCTMNSLKLSLKSNL